MTTFPLDAEAGPASVVASAGAVLADLDEVMWAAKGAEELLEVTVELERPRSHLAAVQAEVVAEIEVTERRRPSAGCRWVTTAGPAEPPRQQTRVPTTTRTDPTNPTTRARSPTRRLDPRAPAARVTEPADKKTS
jgi:hypothetical protein